MRPAPWLLLGLVSMMAGLRFSLPVEGGSDRMMKDSQISVIAYADVAGGDVPDCPHCNLNYDPEDESFAKAHPLGAFTVRLLDDSGEVGRYQSEALDELEVVRIPLSA